MNKRKDRLKSEGRRGGKEWRVREVERYPFMLLDD
jgi:hypothetical protein